MNSDLWKNETTINKKQNCNFNTEETSILKNKIKLLELEKKLLKDDVTNTQKSLTLHYNIYWDYMKPCIREKKIRIAQFSMLKQMSLTLSYHLRE